MLDFNYRSKQTLGIVSAVVLSLSLLGCAQNQPDVSTPNSDTVPSLHVPDKSEQSRQNNYVTTSHILAEPLPQKRIKITITAKDRNLTIVNCNQVITLSLLDPSTKQTTWGGVSNSCRSPDIIIPKDASLSFITDLSNIDEESLPTNTPYLVRITAIDYGSFNNPQNLQMSMDDITSNEFILLP